MNVLGGHENGERQEITLPSPADGNSRAMGESVATVVNPVMRSFFAASGAYKDGTDSPRAFLERCIETIDTQEPRIGAFVATNLDGARAAADAASERWRLGAILSPIDGMPVGIKDIIETADMTTEQGSPLFADWRGGRDAAAVAALRGAGAVVVGKTVTTEFAAPEPRGTRNPWDTERTPGGACSGSAAAVAAGMVTAALGTQVVGSILPPAAVDWGKSARMTALHSRREDLGLPSSAVAAGWR